MTVHRETEIKLRVSNAPALKRLIRKLGFRIVQARHFESNRLYDFADLQLRRANVLLRLRQEGRKCLLTFKGAPLKTPRYKVRGEIETQVESAGRLERILEGLGLREVFRYEKYRTAFVPGAGRNDRGDGKLDFDETPIGTFIELEGSGRWIDRVAARLGYTRADYITASYAALYFNWRRQRRSRQVKMVFAVRK